jgi:3-hydroxy-9,10-secoandrosta-1,3,5(10)-triene-9,17-dione monooxygenase reductase component
VPEIDSAYFRKVMGHVPTPVTVVTGLDADGRPLGLTIGSFTSVSLDPPLVGFFPGVSSASWPRLQQGGVFCVNVLAEGQDELCWRFAKEAPADSDGRFDGVEWRPGTTGAPVLPGVVAWIDCSIHSVTQVGDHWFVVGAVEAMHHGDVDAGDSADAMTFYRGKVSGAQPTR